MLSGAAAQKASLCHVEAGVVKGRGWRGAGNDFLQDRDTCGCWDPEARFPAVRRRIHQDPRCSLERPRYTPGPAGASGKVCAGSDSLAVSYQEGESLSPAPCLVSPAKMPTALHPLPLARSHRLKTCVLCTLILFILLASISFPSDSWRAIDAPGCRLPHFESWSVCDPKATILSNLCFLVFKMGILIMYVPPEVVVQT